MNVNLKLSLTDVERNILARILSAKATKRLATRREVKDLVDGFLAALLHAEDLDDAVPDKPKEPQPVDLSVVPTEYARRPLSWKLGWLRGWNLVGRSLKK